MKRREFMKAGLALAVSSAAGGLPAARAASSTRIPIGFLGVTYSHGPDKVRIVRNSPDWELVGVCDDTAAGREQCERLGVPRISREELLERARVVAVESEVRDHATDALTALRAGKHVHLEKPPATRLSELQAVVAAARDKGLLLQTGYMWRYNPGFEAIIEAVRKGWLGDVYLVRGFISNNLAPARRVEWAEFKGGALFELGSHLVDATVRLLGRPRRTRSELRRHGQFADDLKDNNVVVLEYERATAVLVNTALQASGSPARSFEVLGTNGSASLLPIEPPTLTIDLAKAAGPYLKGAQTVTMPIYRRYEGDLAALAAAVRDERPLSATLDEEALSGEVLLQVSEML